MKKGLTIIVPVWNREALVAHTLDSIACGRRLPEHLIIVDNVSTDHSLQVCQNWANSHKDAGMEIRVLQSSRPGAAVARNVGLAAVDTEWVYFFDSDDEFDTTFISDVMGDLLSPDNRDNDIAFVPTRQNEGGQLTKRAYINPLTAAAQILSSMLATQNIVYRTEWLRSINGWNEDLTTWDDWELGIRVALANPRIMWLTRRAYHSILIHDESLTGPSYASRKMAIVKALQTAVQLAGNSKTTLNALFFRIQIVAGKLEREGDDCDEVLSVAQQLHGDISPWYRAAGVMLRKYVSVGGRGAWRIALGIL